MDRAWVHRSACKGLDPIIFYPATDEGADEAKDVCARCPVQDDCLEHAINNREHNGVWGGATERERQRIIRRRRRMRAIGAKVDTAADGNMAGGNLAGGSVTNGNVAGTNVDESVSGSAAVR